jgi:hypothetical protein
MGLSVQILQDANEGVDHTPLRDFMSWAKQHDIGSHFACHYDLVGGEATITDFGLLKRELEDNFEDPEYFGADKPQPPDIRVWLQSEIDAGRCLAWISW